jgi:hypothetical protein
MTKKKSKSHKKKKRNRKSDYSTYNISGLDQHKKHKKKLSPPLNRLQSMNLSSWMDDHMPEMFWAVMLTYVFDREEYLDCFRKIASLCRNWPVFQNNYDDVDHTTTIDHTTIATFTDEQFHEFIKIPLSYKLGYAALRPLLLIESLPGIDRWSQEIGIAPTKYDWNTLAKAISNVLDHQSQESTDIRWLKVAFGAITGRLYFMEMSEKIEEIRLYPEYGDMRKVRPMIRATEMSLRRNPPSRWVADFWTEAYQKTHCIDPSTERDYHIVSSEIDVNSVRNTRFEVINRFYSYLTSARVDAKLDSALGLSLYGLAIVEEIALHHIHQRIIGRLALRTLVETTITFKYLMYKNDPDLWQTYRVYGAGQAKLAFLKCQEAEDELPSFIDEDSLYRIANEDVWQEFLDIDVGHWNRSNLREMAQFCDAKDIYDRYYSWSSCYAHSHWGAVRDTNFVTCHNPLHRLHRIPRLLTRSLNTIESDALNLIAIILQSLDMLYPGDNQISQPTLIDEHIDSSNT